MKLFWSQVFARINLNQVEIRCEGIVLNSRALNDDNSCFRVSVVNVKVSVHASILQA